MKNASQDKLFAKNTDWWLKMSRVGKYKLDYREEIATFDEGHVFSKVPTLILRDVGAHDYLITFVLPSKYDHLCVVALTLRHYFHSVESFKE